MFSTLNESDLHRTLKIMYSEQNSGITEVEKEGHIFDILTKENEVIEIQTKNLSKLLPKLTDTLNKGYAVRLVHPIVITKQIKTYDEAQKLISCRKSPVKGSIYSMFKELTGIYPILLESNFTLETIEINLIEERLKTNKEIQSINKRRRFKKDWIKTNKKLDEIITTRKFCSKTDYLKLLPENLPEYFCADDLSNCLKETKIYPASASKQSHVTIWVLAHMNLIELTEIINRRKYYKIKNI